MRLPEPGCIILHPGWNKMCRVRAPGWSPQGSSWVTCVSLAGVWADGQGGLDGGVGVGSSLLPPPGAPTLVSPGRAAREQAGPRLNSSFE